MLTRPFVSCRVLAPWSMPPRGSFYEQGSLLHLPVALYRKHRPSGYIGRLVVRREFRGRTYLAAVEAFRMQGDPAWPVAREGEAVLLWSPRSGCRPVTRHDTTTCTQREREYRRAKTPAPERTPRSAQSALDAARTRLSQEIARPGCCAGRIANLRAQVARLEKEVAALGST